MLSRKIKSSNCEQVKILTDLLPRRDMPGQEQYTMEDHQTPTRCSSQVAAKGRDVKREGKEESGEKENVSLRLIKKFTLINK